MKLFQIFLSPKYRIFTILILIFLLAYIISRFLFFDSDPVIPFLSSFFNSYLLLIEMFANQLLYWTGSGVTIENHKVIMNSLALEGFIPMLYFKRWMILFLSLIWITRTTFLKRTLITILLLVVHFLVVSVYVTSGAYLSGLENPNFTLITIPITLGLLILFTIIFIWYRKHKDIILNSLAKLKINTKRLKNDFHVIAVAYIFILLYYFLFDIFDFHIWIDFLFTSAKRILAIFGYYATVEPFYLIGEKGSIFMLKSCLGYQTMLLFAAIVFLTGNASRRIRWTYIISGLLFINFVNILRFVFLFIHIEKHGDYTLAMDVHEMYNYIIYAMVFILWVIWFEKFADSRRKGA
jgi:exosortase/archaeosortase family protein